MQKPFIPHVNVGVDPAYIEAENKRLEKQAHCTHDITVTFKKYDKYSERCEQCGLILKSDKTDTFDVKSHEQML